MAPKCIVGPLKRTGKKNARKSLAVVRRRLQQWHAGQLVELWEDGARRSALTDKKKENFGTAEVVDVEEEELDAGLVRRVLEAASEGALSNACSLLMIEQTVAELTPSTLDALQKLHPKAASPTVAPVFGDPFEGKELTGKQVWPALKSFKKLTAPGLSGLRVSHICEALDTAIRIYRVDLMDALCSLISASSKGLLPAWSAPFFCAARLVPFAKKAGGGVTPRGRGRSSAYTDC